MDHWRQVSKIKHTAVLAKVLEQVVAAAILEVFKIWVTVGFFDEYSDHVDDFITVDQLISTKGLMVTCFEERDHIKR